MTLRLFLILVLAVPLPLRAKDIDRTFDAESLKAGIPTASDLGPDWKPVHPDRWLVKGINKISVFYDYRPAAPTGDKPDSIVADIFIFPTSEEAAKMLEAHRQKTASIHGNVVEDVEGLIAGAYSSHRPEALSGKRITFAYQNLVVTLAPSMKGIFVATQLLKKLRQP